MTTSQVEPHCLSLIDVRHDISIGCDGSGIALVALSKVYHYSFVVICCPYGEIHYLHRLLHPPSCIPSVRGVTVRRVLSRICSRVETGRRLVQHTCRRSKWVSILTCLRLLHFHTRRRDHQDCAIARLRRTQAHSIYIQASTSRTSAPIDLLDLQAHDRLLHRSSQALEGQRQIWQSLGS